MAKIMYEMQVRVWTVNKGYWFASVKPSGLKEKPYRYETELEARKMLDSCYPALIYGEEKRVVPVTVD